MAKKAIVTGITGQDAAYLAELLLEKDYEVYGTYRRTSSVNFWRIEELGIKKHPNLHLIEYDLTDQSNSIRMVADVNPDEIYNLAAQSFVGVSFDQPLATAHITGLGCVHLLEAIRIVNPKIRFYQASTSEMFGEVQEIPQKETTPFYPRSPYGVAKLYAHWMVINYRESYNIFATSGILFNHESVPKNSPLIIQNNEKIEIIPIEDMFSTESHRYEGLLKKYKDALVWNGEDWTKVIAGTSYQDKNKNIKLIQTRESSYEATDDHIYFNEDNEEIKTADIQIGDKAFKVNYPENIGKLKTDLNLSKFIGFVVGDGYIDDKGGIRLIGTDKELLIEMADLLIEQFGWGYRINTYGAGGFETSTKDVWQLDINNNSNFGLWLRESIYTRHSKDKKVPDFILNGDKDVKKAFFDGYYLADGRKAGHETYYYKGFTTNSASLCLGLIYIFKSFSNQVIKSKAEYRDDKNRYYYVTFRTDDEDNIKGEHLQKDLNEVIKISDTKSEDGWFFDIQTESKTFATGSNLFKIHNSPLRGQEFVTRKITDSVAKIKLGKLDCIELGNMDAKRDWGYAKDYVEGMYLMLQAEKAETFVLATNRTETVRDFVTMAFKGAGIEVEFSGEGEDEIAIDKATGKTVVKVNPKFYRPAEVELLIGDPKKAKEKLGWTPKCTLEELCGMMVKEDLRRNETGFSF